MERERTITWPGWEVVRLIGRGGFGEVYEIRRNVFGHEEKAALKVITIPQSNQDVEELRGDGYSGEEITDYFQSFLKDIVREYALMSEMKGHTNIIYCDDLRYIQHDDGVGWDIYIKMELLTPLPEALGQQVSDEQVIRVGIDICNALLLCEGKNIIHRDIKPQNIFVSDDGNYKLGDFGIAKTVERTASGTRIGTYKYIAPEVYNNQPYGSAADVYSLGLVLYWMLNERRTPFLPLPPQRPTASVDEEARRRRLSGESLPLPANGSHALQQIVMKACAFAPKSRYTAEELKAALEALLPAKKTGPIYFADETTVLLTDAPTEPQAQPIPKREPGKQTGAEHAKPVNGHDLYREVTISQAQAEGGCQVTVEGYHGAKLSVTVPARSQNGKQLRCRGCGYPGRDGGTDGDLYITVKVETAKSAYRAAAGNTKSSTKNKSASKEIDALGSIYIALLGVVSFFNSDHIISLYIGEPTETFIMFDLLVALVGGLVGFWIIYPFRLSDYSDEAPNKRPLEICSVGSMIGFCFIGLLETLGNQPDAVFLIPLGIVLLSGLIARIVYHVKKKDE